MFRKIFLIAMMIFAIQFSNVSATNWIQAAYIQDSEITYFWYIDVDSITIDQDSEGILEFHAFYKTNSVDPWYQAEYVIGKEYFMQNKNGKFFRIPYCTAYGYGGEIIYSSPDSRPRRYKKINPDTVSETLFKFCYARL